MGNGSDLKECSWALLKELNSHFSHHEKLRIRTERVSEWSGKASISFPHLSLSRVQLVQLRLAQAEYSIREHPGLHANRRRLETKIA